MSENPARAAASDPATWRSDRWRRQGYDRLYVCDEDGASVGWYDLATGDLHAVEPALEDGLFRYVRGWLATAEARALGELPAPHPPVPTPALRLRPGLRPSLRGRRAG